MYVAAGQQQLWVDGWFSLQDSQCLASETGFRKEKNTSIGGRNGSSVTPGVYGCGKKFDENALL